MGPPAFRRAWLRLSLGWALRPSIWRLGAGAIASSALVNLWRQAPSRRGLALRRHSQSKLVGLMEHLVSILWAVAAGDRRHRLMGGARPPGRRGRRLDDQLEVGADRVAGALLTASLPLVPCGFVCDVSAPLGSVGRHRLAGHAPPMPRTSRRSRRGARFHLSRPGGWALFAAGGQRPSTSKSEFRGFTDLGGGRDRDLMIVGLVSRLTPCGQAGDANRDAVDTGRNFP